MFVLVKVWKTYDVKLCGSVGMNIVSLIVCVAWFSLTIGPDVFYLSDSFVPQVV